MCPKEKVETARLTIVSGGQTGADRGALDAGLQCGIAIGGWCPKGGWAEDYPKPPGLLQHYPQLIPTPEQDVRYRTVANVRDSDCTLIMDMDVAVDNSEALPLAVDNSEALPLPAYNTKNSPGTNLTIQTAMQHNKPLLVANPVDIMSIRKWLQHCWQATHNLTLNVAGPRESEQPGLYNATYITLLTICNDKTIFKV